MSVVTEAPTVDAPPASLVEIEQESVAMQSQLSSVVIVDQETYDKAVAMRVDAKEWLTRVRAFFKGMKDPAYAAWKKICDNEKTACDPVEQTVTKINAALVRWDQEQERIREAQAKLLREAAEAKAREEQRKLAEEAAAKGATEEEVASIAEAPIENVLPAPAPEPTYRRSSAVVFRDNWCGEVTDLHALVKHIAKNKRDLNLLQINQTALNQLAKALKEQMSIPGIRAVNNKVAATGRG